MRSEMIRFIGAADIVPLDAEDLYELTVAEASPQRVAEKVT
jgi:hypothetical protein